MKKFVKWLLKFLTGEGDARAENKAGANSSNCCIAYHGLWVYGNTPRAVCKI